MHQNSYHILKDEMDMRFGHRRAGRPWIVGVLAVLLLVGTNSHDGRQSVRLLGSRGKSRSFGHETIG